MNQIARTPASSVLQGSRIPAGMRAVASFDSASIEEISPQIGANFNDDSFVFRNEKQNLYKDRKDGGFTRLPYSGFSTSSQTFAAMFETMNSSLDGMGSAFGSRPRAFAGLVAKAVQVYEANAKIIHGSNDVLGKTLTLTL